MKTFLEYVAEDIINKYGHDLSRIAIVFPNKRASSLSMSISHDGLGVLSGVPLI